MTITLPDTSSGYAWIASPAWMYDHWHWLRCLIAGAVLMTIGYTIKRIDGRSFATGLLIILGAGPLLVGAICGIAAGSFWMHPSPSTIDQTWMFTEDANHEFRVPINHLPANRYKDPVHDPASDRKKINSDLTTAFNIKALQPQRDATFIQFDASREAMDTSANSAAPYLINGDVYSCSFLTNGITRDQKDQITQINVSGAQCVRGDQSIRLTLR